MVTLAEVAQNAGVSVSTVSHVLNRTRFVAPQTVEKVMHAVQLLDYAPNAVARSLKMRHTRTLGMVVPSNANPFFAEMMNGVERACFARNYSLIICNSDDRLDNILHHVGSLRARRIDGLLAVISRISAQQEQSFAKKCANLPTLLLDGHGHEGLPVYTDNSQLGSYQATRYLIAQGCQHIYCLGGPSNHARTQERIKGFQQALAEVGRDSEGYIHHCADMRAGDAAKAMLEILQKGQQIDGVFCCNDLLAIGALSAIQQSGLRVPDDISVIGYDDIEIAAYTVPPLTTIRQSAEEIGFKAAEVMIDHLLYQQSLPTIIHHPPELVIRGSVKG